tara:strand:+ start:243 stop:428 length:186 start_codon:yes stop_codon:yes gene_type:complete
VYYLEMASYSRTMDFLHEKLLQARTKDQEDKIVNWMLAEAQRNQLIKSFSKKSNKQSELKI